jgi:molecular chaperone GrpE
MLERDALFEKFLTVVQSEPPVPEYLGEEPEAVTPFDPYRMVAEWIALRHEVKQQGKLLQGSQNLLQKALEALETEKSNLQHLAARQQQGLTSADQKALWRDLIGVVDALDQACLHWQAQVEALDQTSAPAPQQPQSFWQRWTGWLAQPAGNGTTVASNATSLRDILVSNQQGNALIRRSLLEVLRQRQVIALVAQGQPFNPQTMYAVGRQENSTVPENTVIQEVVRGYLWGEQVLREAQVIVAVKKA